MVLADTCSPASNTTKSKHNSSSTHRKSLSHASASAAVAAGTGRNSTGTSKSSSSAAAAMVEQPTVTKAKNVCVVEPQSTSKATAVVAPLMAESRQCTKQPVVKSDVSRKHPNHKVSSPVAGTELALVIVVCPMQCVASLEHMSVCVLVHNTNCPRWRPWFLSSLPQIWNVGHTSHNEDQVRCPITLEIVNVNLLPVYLIFRSRLQCTVLHTGPIASHVVAMSLVGW